MTTILLVGNIYYNIHTDKFYLPFCVFCRHFHSVSAEFV